MSWAINERLDVEGQLVRVICHDVARGVWLVGDALPSPHALAQDRVLNPRIAEAAYASLVEAGVLRLQPGGEFRVAEDARRLARDCLLEWAKGQLRDLARALRQAGFSAEDVRRVCREAGDA